jgi:hypothetical protein
MKYYIFPTIKAAAILTKEVTFNMILLVESLLKSLFLYIIVCVCVLPAVQVGQQQDLLILLSEK